MHESNVNFRRLAILGAGISGLTLAAELESFAEVHIFDKARGVGGRMATRYAEPFHFDHGTQFFTARNPEFLTWLKPHLDHGRVAEWTGRVITIQASSDAEPEIRDRPWLEPHYVPSPSMNSLGKHLAERKNIHLNTEVAPLYLRDSEGWHLFDASCNSLGHFDWVISTAPAPQTLRLFAHHLPADAAIARARMQGCFTVMLGFREPWNRDWIAAKVKGSPIEWIGINSTKPQRNNAVTSVVVHSRNDWAQAQIDGDLEMTRIRLLEELESLAGLKANHAVFFQMHRWRYAIVEPDPDAAPFLDSDLCLASTGDWCSASRIEDVWLSARSLAATLRTQL